MSDISGVTIDGTTTHTPIIVDGFQSSQQSRHVIHELLDSADDAITLRPAASPRGSLSALFASLEEAEACRGELASAAVLTYVDTDNPTTNMSFIAIDTSAAELEDESRELAWVRFTFKKVTP